MSAVVSGGPLRFGLVGTGHWARTVHGPGLSAHPETELSVVWGRDPARAAALSASTGARAADSFEELLAGVDAVAFAVPPAIQGALAVQAAEAGRHLLLEKPIALDLPTAERLAGAVADRGLSSVVFFAQRFVPTWEGWLQGLVGAGMSGGRADWLSSQLAPDNPYAASAWRREHGALWDVGPHMLSQLLPVLGPVAEVAGARGAGDLAHLVFVHDSGATSRMSVSLTMPLAAKRITVEFYGDAGWTAQPLIERDLEQAYAGAVGELVANIRERRGAHRCDVAFGRDIVALLERCERALGG